MTADEQALALLARRANGSMRDSQSLLEQLFSFCGNSISVQEVHELLGTADMGRIADISTAMVNADEQKPGSEVLLGIIRDNALSESEIEDVLFCKAQRFSRPCKV